ncbi:MAG: homoserine O-acetyltransferase [Chitinophagaceae bacterium]
MPEIFAHTASFTLESGIVLPQYHLAYSTYGRLNRKKDNVVWVFHALTANSNPEEWWPGLMGDGKLFDPSEYYIVCVNMPGSCYGSIGPLEVNPKTGESWFHQFPFFTTRDMIRAYQPLRKFLGISRIRIGIGGSMGGQQLMEWAVEEPELFEYIFPIATNAFHSPWAIAFNASQRLCIEADTTWLTRHPQAGIAGMKCARSVALISYRHYDTYLLSQSENSNELTGNFKSDSYQRYQGEKLARRFNAFSYYKLSQSMDSHNLGRSRTRVEQALGKVKAKTLVIGIETDILFPLREQQFIAENIPGSAFQSIHSVYGHDGFLIEYEQIGRLILAFIQQNLNRSNRSKKLNPIFFRNVKSDR